MSKRFIFISVLILSILVTQYNVESQEYFPIGVWFFGFQDDETLYERPTGSDNYHLEEQERQLLLNLGINYMLAGMSVNAERAFINFGDSLSGDFRSTLAWARENPPWASPDEMWRCSYYGSVGDPDWQNRVQNGYSNINAHYGTSPGLHSFLIGAQHGINNPARWDEVDYMCDYVSGLVQRSVVQDSWHANEPDFVYNVEHMDIFMMQVYPFTSTTPYTGPNNQAAIQLMADRWDAIISAISQKNITYGTNTEFVAIVQTQESNCFNFRYPTREEILCSVSMGLCYGAHGIVYYLYAYSDYGGGDFEQGLLDDTRQPTAQYNHVSDININYLAHIGSELRGLTWQYGFNSESIPPDSYIDDIEGDQVVGTTGTIEIGIFQNPPAPADDYFMLVNRLCSANEYGDPANPQTITVHLESSSNRRLIEDVLASRTPWDRHPNRVAYRTLESGENTFTVTLNPGEGRLFRVSDGLEGHLDENLFWSGDVFITGDITVESTDTLMIYPGTTVIFAGYRDDQHSGRRSDRSELTIQGKLEADTAGFTSTIQNAGV